MVTVLCVLSGLHLSVSNANEALTSKV